MRTKKLSSRMLSLLLVLVTLCSVILPAQAATIADGSMTCTVSKAERHYYLSTTAGATMGANGYTYTTNDGIRGSAYCINWGLALTSKSLEITGRYTASPRTMGAFANGYPQRSVADYIKIYGAANPEIVGLTEAEFAYATQLAVWASLGQIAVEGTGFTSGSRTIAKPVNGTAQQIRVFRVLELILSNCWHWTKPLYTGMYVRGESDMLGNAVEIPADMTISEAAAVGLYGIAEETIGGVDYYTREFTVASATSTWYNDYCIEVWLDGAPAGSTIVAQDNSALENGTWDGKTTKRVPTSNKPTNLNANGAEYSGVCKVCIPVENAGDGGLVTLRTGTIVTQYDIYLAHNPTSTEQSYIISDPNKAPMTAYGTLSWGGVESEFGKVTVIKVDGGSNPLPGAKFSLSGSDGSVSVGTSNAEGMITWTDLNAEANYTLTETQAPEGYGLIDPMNVSVVANRTTFITVRNTTEKQLTIKKTDAQNGYSLYGAVFAFEQIDGSYRTELTTGHDGTIQLDATELPTGSYRVYEKTAPEGYEKDATVKTVHWTATQDITLNFENVRKPSLVIVKTNAAGRYTLPDAVLEVYRDGTLITSGRTNDAGELVVSGLTEGYYEVIEKSAPAGYVLDTTPYGIHIDPYDPATEDDPVLIVANKEKPSLQIVKYDAVTMQRIAGATFEVYRDTTLVGNYVTDADGEIWLNDLDPGTYLVREVGSAPGYVINSSPQQIELIAGETGSLVFLNLLKPGIHLIKVDADTLKPLANGKFLIELVGGTYSKEFTTDENGEIDLTSLTPGAYTVTELAAPSGYLIDDAQRIIQINAGENAQFVFTNERQPSLTVVKYDPYKDKYLPGAIFKVSKIEDGSHYLDRITGTGGSFTIENLDPGIYSVVELNAPSGYVLNSTEYHVELFPGQNSQLVVNNATKPSLEIIKTDAESGVPLEGATYTVRRVDNATVTTVTTLNDGKVLLENLEPGVYEVTEQSVPDNYLLDPTPRKITLEPNQTGTVQFQNHTKPVLEIKKTDPDGNPIAGAVFRVKVKNGDVIGDYTTKADGTITIPKLLPQYYTITEVSVPDAYVLNTHPRDVLLEAGKTTSIVIENDLKPGLTIHKIDSVTGSPVKGAKFHIWYAGAGAAAGTLTDKGFHYSDADGKIILPGLTEGWYRVTEVEPATGYELKDPSTQDIYVKPNTGATLIFENIPKSAIVIVKRDADTGDTLQGAQFQLRYLSGVSGTGGTVIGTYTTNYNGTIIVTGLKAGTYIVEETKAPDHYVIDGATQTVYVSGRDQDVITVEFDNHKYAGLVIKKLDSVTKKPIADVTFKVTDSSGAVVGESNGLFTTDDSGVIQIPNIPVGSYVVQEYTPAPGYVMDETSQTVKVESNRTYTLTFYNTPKGSLVINKLDSMTGKPLAGATFKIIYSNGQYVDNAGGAISSNGLYKTDKTGQIIITGLEPNTYVVTEVDAPSGYVLDTLSQTVVVNTHDTQTLTFYNTPSGGLRIVKSDADTGARISGVRFEVAKMNGEIIGKYVTDASGVIALPDIGSGWYTVTELKAANGYRLDATPQRVQVKDGETALLELANEKSASIIIHKTDSKTGKGIYGVSFILYDAGRNPIGQYTTDQSGYVYIEEELTAGRYYLREFDAPAGYIPDTQYKTVYVTGGKTSTIEWENAAITGQIQIYKYSEDYNPITGKPAGSALPSAVFEVVRAESGVVQGYYTTDARGVAATAPLPLGRYIIKEVTAPAYYQCAGTSYEATLKIEGDIVKLTVFNKSATLGVSITKTGNKEVSPGSSMRYDFTVANTSNVPLDSFYWHDRIPTDAVRAQTLITGTYSQRLTYRILYKTNYNDYRVLASNLLSTNNYSFALNALSMMSGEYVTDVYFDFGTVHAGFQSKAQPMLTVSVLSPVTNAYQIVNRSDVGGKYLNTWQTANANWITIVRKIGPIPTLPKTGY